MAPKKKSKKKTTKKKVAKNKTVKKKKTVKKAPKKKAAGKSATKKQPEKVRRLKNQEKSVDDMLRQLESVKPMKSRRKKSIRPMSATVTLLSIIGIIISGFVILPKGDQYTAWGSTFLVVFFILLIASIYSLTID